MLNTINFPDPNTYYGLRDCMKCVKERIAFLLFSIGLMLSFIIPNILVVFFPEYGILMSNIEATSVFIFMLALLSTGFVFGKDRIESLCFVWIYLSTAISCIWDFGYIFVNVELTRNVFNPWLFMWWGYGIADTRYIHNDLTVYTLELITGILAWACLFGYIFIKDGVKKRLIMLVESVAKLITTLIFFLMELIQGFPDVPIDFFGFCVKFGGLNLLWIIMPLISIIYSSNYILKRNLDSFSSSLNFSPDFDT